MGWCNRIVTELEGDMRFTLFFLLLSPPDGLDLAYWRIG